MGKLSPAEAIRIVAAAKLLVKATAREEVNDAAGWGDPKRFAAERKAAAKELRAAIDAVTDWSERELAAAAEGSGRAQRDPLTGRAPLIPEGNSRLGQYRIHHQIGL